MVYVASVLSSLSMMNMPAITAIKSTLSAGNEQGQVIGSISSVQAIAGGLGPAIFNSLYSLSLDPGNSFTPRLVWWAIACIMMIAVAFSLTVPDPRPIRKQMELEESLLGGSDGDSSSEQVNGLFDSPTAAEGGGGSSLWDQAEEEKDIVPSVRKPKGRLDRFYEWVAVQ